jgi:hypothetical protein
MFITTDLYFINPIMGGDANNILKKMNTQNFKNITNIINNLNFEIKDDNNKIEENIKILGMGVYSVVFSIKLLQSSTNYQVILTECKKEGFNENIFDNLILKISEDNYDDTFIEKYKEEKKIYNKNIMKIFFRGNIYINNNKLGNYIITKKYYNDNNIKFLSLELRLNALIDIYKLLKKIDDNDKYYWDLKYVNMGIDESGNYIILDYDKNTIKQKNNYIDNMSYFGTYIPFFYYNFISNIPKQENFQINNNIIYVAGLSDILINLFEPEIISYEKYKNIFDKYKKIYSQIYDYSKIYELFNIIKLEINKNIIKLIGHQEIFLRFPTIEKLFNDYIYIDYYKILNIERHTSTKEIYKAYKKMLLKYHPDKNSFNPKFAEILFNYVNEANNLLKETELKSAYDNFIIKYDEILNNNIISINEYTKTIFPHWEYKKFIDKLKVLKETINFSEIKKAKEQLDSFHKLIEEKKYIDLLLKYILYLLCIYSKIEVNLIATPEENLKHIDFFESINFFLSK